MNIKMFIKNKIPKFKKFIKKVFNSWITVLFLIIIILGLIRLLVIDNQKAEERGGIKKSKQIGEVAKLCTEIGGLLFIQQDKDALSIECITISIEVESLPIEGVERII